MVQRKRHDREWADFKFLVDLMLVELDGCRELIPFEGEIDAVEFNFDEFWGVFMGVVDVDFNPFGVEGQEKRKANQVIPVHVGQKNVKFLLSLL